MLAALLWWGGAEAQDVILLRNADEVKAEVREITDSHILYTLWGGSDKVLSLPRAEVFSVTYQNGEKELFVGDDSGATGPVTAADYPWPRVTKSYRPGDLFDEDGIRGIVISTTDNGRHGLILSLEQAPKSLRWSADSSWATDLLLGLSDREDGWNNRRRLIERLAEGKLTWEDFPAFEWCESLGPGCGSCAAKRRDSKNSATRRATVFHGESANYQNPTAATNCPFGQTPGFGGLRPSEKTMLRRSLISECLFRPGL